MSYIVSPNMNLPIPGVGTESGPNYAIDVNNSLTLVDSHDHSAGKGVQITPAGMNINASLTLNGNFLTAIGGLTLTAQSVTPAINTVYESGVDLFFVDGNGNNIRITQSGAVAGTPGSIANLVSPASASYVSGSSTFVWQSNTNIAANMDFGSALLRNLSPNSTYALTLSPPTLSSDYTITLPYVPANTSFITMDSSGNLASSISTSLGITASNIANSTITAAKIVPGTLTTTQLSASAGILKSQLESLGQQVSSPLNFTTSSGSFVNITGASVSITTEGRPVWVGFIGSAGALNEISATSAGSGLFGYNIKILRDGVEIGRYESLTNAGSIMASCAQPFTIDATSAGAHTYTAQMSGANFATSVTILGFSFMAYEL